MVNVAVGGFLILTFWLAAGDTEPMEKSILEKIAQKPPRTMITEADLSGLTNQEVKEAFKKYGSSHQYHAAGVAGDVLLKREIAEEGRPSIIEDLAKVYEAIQEPWSGPLARSTYALFLTNYPDHPDADAIALRLGELYDHIILPGTSRDPNSATLCFQRIIDRYVNDENPKKNTDMVVLRAYIHLGNMHARQGRINKANECFEAIYYSDTSRLINSGPGPANVAKSFNSLRQMVKRRLVSMCQRPTHEATMAAFSELEQKFSDDLEILALAKVKKDSYLERAESNARMLSR